MDFNRYFTNGELDALLQEWVSTYPRLMALHELGKSHEGNLIPLLIITNQATGSDRDKPAVWLDANIHATELAGTTTALYIAHSLLSGYGKDSQISRLLDRSAFYIAPRLNPDGAALAMADQPEFVRSGTRPYPFDELDEGLHMADVDGDGRILTMRVPDPNGEWKISSLDPRLMERRGPDEAEGDFFRIFPEGRIQNFDGVQIKMARSYRGLDFNRNFPFEWKPENEQQGAGPYPASEAEIRAMVDFIADHRNINTAITYHTFSGVILRPFSTRADEEMETNDLWVYQLMGERATELTGYKCISVYHDFRYHPKQVTTGAFDDWVYDYLGLFAFTVELWDLPGRAGIEDRHFIEWFRKHPHEDDLKILRWLEENGGSDAIVDWYAFDHPQLGAVELGGIDFLYTWRNPPHHFMQEEAARNLPFALSLAEMLPRLHLHTLEANRLEDDSYHVRLVVENDGFLPTFTSEQGKKRQASRPVRVQLSLPDGAKLLSGRLEQEVGHLRGRSHRLDTAMWGAASPTDNRTQTEWVIRAEAGGEVRVTVQSDRAGRIEKVVDLA